MLYVSSASFYDERNVFRVKEIYVSDGQVTYVMRSSVGFVPEAYPMNFLDIHKPVFSTLMYSPVRTVNDDDARTLAEFLHDGIKGMVFGGGKADKTLYDVIANFGEPYSG